MKVEADLRLWTARILIGLVIAWNLQAALIFLISPQGIAPGFELDGIPGTVAVRGVGILFVMWNIPYLVACWHPRRKRISLWEALAMQLVGVLGESAILLTLPAGHATLHGTLLRFIVFDVSGLAALVAAFVLTRH
jgi:hypothetical protein